MTSKTLQDFDHSAAYFPGVTGPSNPAAFDAWLESKVLQSLNDERPTVPHAQVMAQMDDVIREAEPGNQATVR